MQIVRRSFLTGLGSLFVAAPAIVRASSLMPVRAIVHSQEFTSHNFFLKTAIPVAQWRAINMRAPYSKMEKSFLDNLEWLPQ